MKAQRTKSNRSSPTAAPSVFGPTPSSDHASPSSMEAFTSTLPEGSDASSRRQRITMACHYCRHRKIRCCGGAPCRNCTRSQRECEYAPVPEEVNRATREKKAHAKASKMPSFSGPIGYPYFYPDSSPYFTDTPVFDGPYVAGPGIPSSSPMAGRPSNFAHRRSVSVPNFEASLWTEHTPSAPQLQSPAMFESPQWMYNGGGWSPAAQGVYMTPQSSPFPSVLDPPVNQLSIQTGVTGNSTPSSNAPFTPVRVNDMPPLPTAWSTPNLHHQNVNQATTSSPVSPFYTPYPTTYRAPYPPRPIFGDSINLNADVSPTLAPEMSDSMSGKDLIGLGLAVPNPTVDVFGPTTMLSDDYFVTQAGY